jgi:hypothetical protein
VLVGGAYAGQTPQDIGHSVLQAPLDAAGRRWTPLDNGGPMEAAADLLNWADRNVARCRRELSVVTPLSATNKACPAAAIGHNTQSGT